MTAAQKSKVCIVSAAWGAKYIDELINITLPAVLAPGNLPVLAERFACEMVLVIERRYFQWIRDTDIHRQLMALCPVRLLPIDDLVSPWYGISLTYAFMRAVSEAGERMVDTHFVFFNADFILANGCYLTLANAIESGHSLIFAPSYCVNSEQVAPILLSRRNAVTGTIALAPREMAALALKYRHNTVKAKTVNQRLFRIHRYDQFYWQADDETLLGRQMPIAVISLRPQRVVTELETFWDYGLVSELCPSTPYHVLGDSDDFMMVELRQQNALAEFMAIGTPSLDEIASDLSSYATAEHRVALNHPLVLHTGDLGPSRQGGERQFMAFIDQIRRRMSDEPVPYLKHKFWEQSITEFKALQRQLLQVAAAPATSPYRITGWTPDVQPAPNWRGWIYFQLAGRSPNLRPGHPDWATYKLALDHMLAHLSRGDGNILHVVAHPVAGVLSQYLDERPGSFVRIDGVYAQHNLINNVLGSETGFDLCVAELEYDALPHLPQLYRNIRPRLKADGCFIALYINNSDRPIAPENLTMLTSFFPDVDSGRIKFSGNRTLRWAKALFAARLRYRQAPRIWSRLLAMGALFFAILFSLYGNFRSRSIGNNRVPAACTSLTIIVSRGADQEPTQVESVSSL